MNKEFTMNKIKTFSEYLQMYCYNNFLSMLWKFEQIYWKDIVNQENVSIYKDDLKKKNYTLYALSKENIYEFSWYQYLFYYWKTHKRYYWKKSVREFNDVILYIQKSNLGFLYSEIIKIFSHHIYTNYIKNFEKYSNVFKRDDLSKKIKYLDSHNENNYHTIKVSNGHIFTKIQIEKTTLITLINSIKVIANSIHERKVDFKQLFYILCSFLDIFIYFLQKYQIKEYTELVQDEMYQPVINKIDNFKNWCIDEFKDFLDKKEQKEILEYYKKKITSFFHLTYNT